MSSSIPADIPAERLFGTSGGAPHMPKSGWIIGFEKLHLHFIGIRLERNETMKPINTDDVVWTTEWEGEVSQATRFLVWAYYMGLTAEHEWGGHYSSEEELMSSEDMAGARWQVMSLLTISVADIVREHKT